MIRFVASGAAILAVIACGGTGTPTAAPETAPAPSAVALPHDAGSGAPEAGGGQAWAAVMKPGATFTFDNRLEDPDIEYDAITVAATVIEVEDVEGGRAIVLDWSENGRPMRGGGLPGVILVGSTDVTFYEDRDGFAARDPDAATYPFATVVGGLPEGRYIERRADGELCYGIGPDDDAGDCEDVCYAHLCVHPTHGLTGGEGLWWPDYTSFERTDLR